MQIKPTLHSWSLTTKEAPILQKQLASQVIDDQPLDFSAIHTVAGVDVSVKNNQSRSAIVVLSFPDLQVIEAVTAIQPTPFPYVPGLLSFREAPVILEAFEQLVTVPDVCIFDGMGRIHPRKIGIASHVGLWLPDIPTIGCGKTHFIGDYAPVGIEEGSISPLTYHGEQLGVVLRTRTNVKPVYISCGHLCDLPSAVELVQMCVTRYRLPEPIRAAHRFAGDF
jgi:deoxyribonuclease V